jgi:hypothetical protein
MGTATERGRYNKIVPAICLQGRATINFDAINVAGRRQRKIHEVENTIPAAVGGASAPRPRPD